MQNTELDFLTRRDEAAFAQRPNGDNTIVANVPANIRRLSRPIGPLHFGAIPESQIVPIAGDKAKAYGQKLHRVKQCLEGNDDGRKVTEIVLPLSDFFPWLYLAFEIMQRKERLDWLGHLTKNTETAQRLNETLSVGWRSSSPDITQALAASHDRLRETSPPFTPVSQLELLSGVDPSVDAKDAIEKAWQSHILDIDDEPNLAFAIWQWLYLADFIAVPQALHSEQAKLLLVLPDKREQHKVGHHDLIRMAARMRHEVKTPVIMGVNNSQPKPNRQRELVYRPHY